MTRRSKPLVSQFVESVSRKALEDYQHVIQDLVRRRHGIYVLYSRGHLYYVGLASNLRTRLKAHLRDRHGESWDRFSVYLTIEDGHIKELESLALRIVRPKGNRTGGRFAKAENLHSKLARAIREQDTARLKDILGSKTKKSAKKQVLPESLTGRAPILANYAVKGCELRATYKGHSFKARVCADGSIRFARETYNSPSLAAHAVLRSLGRPRAVNGWWFWHYERAPGDWVRLNELRK